MALVGGIIWLATGGLPGRGGRLGRRSGAGRRGLRGRAALWSIVGFVVAGVMLVCSAGAAMADTQVSSSISADTTWTTAGSPYVLDANVSVDGGVTLTIDPGVTVEFNNGQSAYLTVNGTLDAEGTSGSPVTFTSSQGAAGSGAPGQYTGIIVQAGSSNFSYTNFDYGGYGTGGYYAYGVLSLNGGSVTVDHSDFENNQYSGVQNGAGGTATVSYSTFEHNGDGLSEVGLTPGPLFLSHSTVADNADVGVFFDIGSSSATSSSLLYNTITANGVSGVDLQESCSNSPSSFPHGEWNNIYANNSGTGEAGSQLATLPVCRALPVDWLNNYWGSDVYYYHNNPGCAGTSDSFPGVLAYTWSQPNPSYQVPSGPIGQGSNLHGSYPNYYYCGWNSVAVGPGQFQTSLIADAGATPGSGAPGPTGTWQWGGFPAWGPNLVKELCRDPVDCATGNLYESYTDLSVPGPNGGLTLTRSYNSQAAASASQAGPLGYGWTFDFGGSLSFDPSGQDVTVMCPDGGEVTFTETADGSYSAPPWVQATLSKNQDGSYAYTLPDQRVYTFGPDGELDAITDQNGNTTSLAYSGSGQLQSVTDPAGRQLSFAYNGGGQIQQVTDPAGRTVSYGYDPAGNLTSVTDVRGGTWTFGYDAMHELTSITDPLGGVVSNTYDSSQRVVSQTDAMNRKTTWSYTPGDTQVTLPGGSVTDEQFTEDLPTQIIKGYGTSSAAITSIVYDANDNPSVVTDPDLHSWSYGYDSAGDQTSATDPLDRVTTRTYNSLHEVTSITNPAGVTTTNAYDPHGNLQSTSTPLAGTGQTQRTTYAYDDPSHPGDVTAITDPDGNKTTYTYDSHGDLASVTDPLGNETTYGYDSIGRVETMVTPRGNVTGTDPSSFTTTYGYNPASQLTSKTDPLGHTQSWDYDDDGNLGSYTDANNHKTTYTYNADNELTKVTRPDGTTLQTAYYDTGTISSQTDGSGNATTYDYNPLDELTSRIDPLSRQTTYGYNAAGDLTKMTDPEGRVTSYGYNADHELTSTSYSDAQTPSVSYAYNSDGTRASMSDGTGSSSYAYDSLGRLKSTTDGAGSTIAYGYDLANNVTSITYPNNKVLTRAFDADERLQSVTDWQGNTTTFAYGPDSNLKTTTFPAPTANVDTYSYDNADQIAGIQIAQGSSTLADLTYTRNPNGQLSGATETGLPEPSSQGARGYNYNNADDPTQLDGTTGYNYDNADELTSSPGNTYAYDPLGERTATNPTSGNATGYAYDQAGELTTYTPPAGNPTTYAYNGDGLRTSKTTAGNTSTFTWDQTPGLPQVLTDGQNSYIYGPDDLPVEQINQSGAPSYLHQDQLGSTRLITSQNGNTTASFTYNPYGNLTASSGSTSTPFGYAGQYTDPESGLIYMRARYYDPTTGQFLTPDPLQAITRETYAYTNDNPTNETDPTGAGFFTKFLSTVGLGIAAGGADAACGVPVLDTVACPAAVDLDEAEGAQIAADLGDAAAGDETAASTSETQADQAANCTPATEDGSSAIEQAASKVPDEWGPGEPARSGGGWRWIPNKGDYIRVDPGNPDSSDPLQQVDHVHVTSNGRVVADHLPLSEWLQWGSWNQP